MFDLVYMALLGAVIGSFLNVVILRKESGEALTGRSHCPECMKKLEWYELIPLFSYLFQRGRCRTCRTPLSVQYPLVEFATACIFVMVYTHQVPSIQYLMSDIGSPLSLSSVYLLLSTLLHLAVWSTLVVIFVYDLRTKYIPDRYSLLFALLASAIVLLEWLACTAGAAQCGTEVAYAALAGFALFVPFYLLWKVSDGRWMGLGDGKLAVGIGILLGLGGGFAAVVLSFWLGALVSLGIIAVQRVLRQRNKTQGGGLTLKSEVPFGPFLVIGTLWVYLWGIPWFLTVSL